MTTAQRRARLALTLAGLLIAAIGLIVYVPASIDSDAADQADITNSAAGWADVLGYETDQATREAAFQAEQDKRIAEEDKTFGLVLLGIGLVVFASRWAVRPTLAGETVPAAPFVPPVPVTAPAPPAPVPVADELGKLAALRDRGVLSDSEFERQKRQLLGD